VRAFGRSLARPLHRAVTFGGRSYRIDRTVFDPQRHLSGVAFASQLPSLLQPGIRVLEIGTGCGLLAGVAAQCGASVVATDISQEAVTCARRNLADLDVDVRHGDLFAPVVGETFDLVLCNPPYEVGGSRDVALSSPDFLARFGAEAQSYGDRLAVGFPAADAAQMSTAGLDVQLWRIVHTAGDDLGIFVG
jgi:methylase of polypeptide subunit release factors